MSTLTTLRHWVKTQEHPMARFIFSLAKQWRSASMPVIPGLHGGLYLARGVICGALSDAKRKIWDTPLFLSQVRYRPKTLFLYGGVPLILGKIELAIGENCRMSGQTTLTGRSNASVTPMLSIGRNCDIGWQTTIAVGTKIRIGHNVRIAGRAFLAGYPGHPLDAQDRAQGLPCRIEQSGEIILEDDVWLATGVTVSAGVTIGAGTIVAAGSVVTHDLPPHVLAGGVPARVIRPLPIKEAHHGA